MSEEEIVNKIKEKLDFYKLPEEEQLESELFGEGMPIDLIQGLLDLYNKEKEKNEKLEWKYKKLEHKYKRLRCDYNFTHELQRRDMIHKCQIIRKIKELSNGTYDAKIILQELLEE